MLKFHEYIAKREGISLEEAARRSLSRTWQLAQTGKCVGIITAFRGENPFQTNMARNQRLAQDLRGIGFGFIPVVGTFVENGRDSITGQETGHRHKVEEQSFLFSCPDSIANDSLYTVIVALVRKYEQEAAVVKYSNSEDAFLIANDGKQISLGKWNKDRLAQFYTRMKFGADAPGRSFTFEYADDTTLSTRMRMRHFRE